MGRHTKALIALAIVGALGVPAVAIGAPATAAADRLKRRREQRAERVLARVERALRTRKARFDGAVERLERKTGRIGELATVVRGKGGDIGAVEALLTESEDLLTRARATEARAVEQFLAVPSADQPHVAFRTARDTAKEAVKQLKGARQKAREAAVELRRVAAKLKGGER